MFFDFFSLQEIFSIKSLFFNLVFSTSITLYSYIIIKYSFFNTLKRIDLEKTSSYECGFNPYIQNRTKFDFKFYTISIIFLIFDIEIVLLLPISLLLSYLIIGLTTIILYIFLFILILGLFLEINTKLFI